MHGIFDFYDGKYKNRAVKYLHLLIQCLKKYCFMIDTINVISKNVKFNIVSTKNKEKYFELEK
jgi:hypothetical protein